MIPLIPASNCKLPISIGELSSRAYGVAQSVVRPLTVRQRTLLVASHVLGLGVSLFPSQPRSSIEPSSCRENSSQAVLRHRTQDAYYRQRSFDRHIRIGKKRSSAPPSGRALLYSLLILSGLCSRGVHIQNPTTCSPPSRSAVQ